MISMATCPANRVPPNTAGAVPAARIPLDAICETEISFRDHTDRAKLFGRLQREGQAWMGPDGRRYFERRHRLVRKRLVAAAGVTDEEWETSLPSYRRESQAWAEFIERVEVRVDELVRSAVAKGAAERRACDELGPQIIGQPVAVGTYRDRRRRYLDSGRRRSSMLPKQGRRAGDGGIDPDAWAFFIAMYLTKQRRSVRLCYDRTAAEAKRKTWSWPSYRTIARLVAREWPAQRADFYRLGERAWRMRHGPKLVRDKHDLAANQAWEIDHGRFDFWARHGKRRIRPWLTLIIDRGSNLPVGWAVTTNPSSDSLCLAIRRAVKTYGAPRETVLDNGEDMKARSFGNKRGWLDPEMVGGVFEQLGIELHWCATYTPYAKGQVEAMMRTVHGQFDKLFTSYCGGSINAKPDGIDRWVREHHDELPTLEEVEGAFGEWVGTFAERPSDAEGVKPLSPRQRFDETRIAKRTVPDHVLNVILLKLTAPRRVTSSGVLWNGIRYADDRGRLFEYQGRQVRLRVDPDDISFVWCCDLNGKPLFTLGQNVVRGTADDVRRAMNRRQRARRSIRDAYGQRRIAMDDTLSAVLRAQREVYAERAAKHEPPEPPPAPLVTPITTEAAQAVTEQSELIKREEKRRKVQAQIPPERDECDMSWEDVFEAMAPDPEPDADDLDFDDDPWGPEEIADLITRDRGVG